MSPFVHSTLDRYCHHEEFSACAGSTVCVLSQYQEVICQCKSQSEAKINTFLLGVALTILFLLAIIIFVVMWRRCKRKLQDTDDLEKGKKQTKFGSSLRLPLGQFASEVCHPTAWCTSSQRHVERHIRAPWAESLHHS